MYDDNGVHDNEINQRQNTFHDINNILYGSEHPVKR